MSLIHQPIRVDGHTVKGMRVHELKSALTAVGVAEASFPRDKPGKLALLTSVLSAQRSNTGLLGSLEDGQSINDLSFDLAVAEVARRGGDVDALDPHQELQRVVRILTSQPNLGGQPPVAPPPAAAGEALTVNAHDWAAAAVQTVLPAPGALATSPRNDLVPPPQNVVTEVLTSPANPPAPRPSPAAPPDAQLPAPQPALVDPPATQMGVLPMECTYQTLGRITDILPPTRSPGALVTERVLPEFTPFTEYILPTGTATEYIQPTGAVPTRPFSFASSVPPSGNVAAVQADPAIAPFGCGGAFARALPHPGVAHQPILIVSPESQCRPGSSRPFEGKNPHLEINSNSALFRYLYNTGTLDMRGGFSLLTAQLMLCCRCRPRGSLSAIRLNSTVSLGKLNSLALLYSDALETAVPATELNPALDTFEHLVLAGGHPTLGPEDFYTPVPEADLLPLVPGVETLLSPDAWGSGSMSKWFITARILGDGAAGMGSPAASRIINAYVFDSLGHPPGRLPSGRRDLESLDWALPEMFVFNHIPGRRHALHLKDLMTCLRENEEMRAGLKSTHDRLLPETLKVLRPPARLLMGVLLLAPPHEWSIVVDELRGILFPVEVLDKPPNLLQLRNLDQRLAPYCDMIQSSDASIAVVELSLDAAMALCARIRARQSTARDIGSSSGSSSSQGGPGSALARRTAAAVSQAQAVIEAVDNGPFDLDGQLATVKLVLRARFAILVEALTKDPTPAAAAAVPALKAIALARPVLPRFVAHELLKGSGLSKSSVLESLTKVLPLDDLVGLIAGKEFELEDLIQLFNNYSAVMAPGARAFSLRSLEQDLGPLPALEKFVIRLYACLGMDASNLAEVFAKATSLAALLPAQHMRMVSAVLVADVDDSLEAYARSTAAFLSTHALTPPPTLQLAGTHTNQALEQVVRDRMYDLSHLGFPSKGIYAATAANLPPLGSALLPSIMPSGRVLSPPPVPTGRKRSNSSGGSSQSGGGFGGKAKSGQSPSVRFSGGLTGSGSSSHGPGLGGGSGGANPGSPIGLSHQLCSIGRVVTWANVFVHWGNLKLAWSAKHPSLRLNDDAMRVILTNQASDAAFSRFVPLGASTALVHALRDAFDSKLWKDFVIDRPLDFH